MKARTIVLICVVIWSLLVRYIVWPIARLTALVSDRVRDQLKGRLKVQRSVVELAARRRAFDDCVVFFCSSAGEYEQARPLIDRISRDKKTLCHVVFFSTSGSRFVSARNDEVSWSLAPLDDVFEWGTVFSALRPSVTFVVRHELWPAFLWIASQWSKIIIINAVLPSLLGRQSQVKEGLNLLAKSWLLRFADLVCVVSKADHDFFKSRLFLPEDKVQITGDTKYDRVIERASNSQRSVEALKKIFRVQWSLENSDLVLIAGSVHLPDVELLVDLMRHEELKRLRVLLVPHDITSANIAKIFELVSGRGYAVELFSELKSLEFRFPEPQPRFIIVDELGRLFDLYSVADVAWVGGAVHDKVHNVLEPAAWGAPVFCGSKIENSQEAVSMRAANILKPVNDALQAKDVLLEMMRDLGARGRAARKFAESMAGSSSRILSLSGLALEEVSRDD